MPDTVIRLTHSETAAQLRDRLSFAADRRDGLLSGVRNYLSQLFSGGKQGTVKVCYADYTGTKASGTVTISSGSGVITATVNGVAVSVTWATSDNNTAALLATAIGNSAALRQYITVGVATNVVTITAAMADASGDSITLTATGTGASASAATLTGSKAAAASGTITMATSSGTVGAVINGVTITVTWATSDAASSTALAVAINASANALVKNMVTAAAVAGVTTITAADKSAYGNAITLTATGTNVTASGSGRLTGGLGYLSSAFTTFSRS